MNTDAQQTANQEMPNEEELINNYADKLVIDVNRSLTNSPFGSGTFWASHFLEADVSNKLEEWASEQRKLGGNSLFTLAKSIFVTLLKDSNSNIDNDLKQLISSILPENSSTYSPRLPNDYQFTVDRAMGTAKIKVIDEFKSLLQKSKAG